MREFEPRRPAVIAALVFFAAGLVLFWPIFTGQFMPGDDQVLAGYGFRLFGAEYFREHGRIPLWNPYLFGGMPFIVCPPDRQFHRGAGDVRGNINEMLHLPSR